MNFPFFMLMVGPSQTGKTTWIFNFIKYFSHINQGHVLKNVLFLHMTEFINSGDLDDDSFKNVTFHSVKNTMSNDELKMDGEIIPLRNSNEKSNWKKATNTNIIWW